MPSTIISKTFIPIEPAAFGKDKQDRKLFHEKLTESLKKKGVSNFDAIGSRLRSEFAAFTLTFYLDQTDFEGRKKESPRIDTLSTVPIDSVYENLAGDVRKHWLVSQLISKKIPSETQGVEISITSLSR